MPLSDEHIAKAEREPGSIELCMKQLYQVTEELEKDFEAFQKRLEPILRERNSEIEDDRKLVPASLTVPIQGKSGFAVELVTIIQKLRLIKVQSESILRNLDL